MTAQKDAAIAFAENVAAIKYDDIPAQVIDITKKDILDTIGVAIAGGSVGLGCKEIVELVKDWGGKEESTILSYGGKVPAWAAAFANGAMAHSLDYDDTLDHGATHLGAGTIPAALAVAERAGKVSGKEFLAAIALGLDVGGRIALAAQPRGIVSGRWAMPIVGGYFSGAAAAAKILKLDRDQIANAFGHAYNMCSGGFELIWSVGSLKGIYPAYTGKSGVLAALMAQKGIPGPRTALEGRAGLFPLYFSNDYDPKILTDSLGKRFIGADISFKPWPSCRWSHAALDATFGLIKENSIQRDSIQQVTVFTNDITKGLFEPLEVRQRPSNITEAQFSLPYILATAVTKGKVEIAAFTAEGRKDPETLAFTKNVIPKYDASLNGKDFAARVEIKTDKDTYSKQLELAYGHPQNPVSMDDLKRKARDCFSYSVKPIAAEKAARVIDRLANLEKEANVMDVLGALA